MIGAENVIQNSTRNRILDAFVGSSILGMASRSGACKMNPSKYDLIISLAAIVVIVMLAGVSA